MSMEYICILHYSSSSAGCNVATKSKSREIRQCAENDKLYRKYSFELRYITEMNEQVSVTFLLHSWL